MVPKWLNPRNFLAHLPPVTQDGIHDGNRGRDRDGDLDAIVGQKTRMPGRILPWTKKTVGHIALCSSTGCQCQPTAETG